MSWLLDGSVKPGSFMAALPAVASGRSTGSGHLTAMGMGMGVEPERFCLCEAGGGSAPYPITGPQFFCMILCRASWSRAGKQGERFSPGGTAIAACLKQGLMEGLQSGLARGGGGCWVGRVTMAEGG